uniref:glucuronosyltransferase n=2 Tax=Panagrellus redivivus TaxID=6233 RepID=A0A7E4VS57_PANRE
MKNTLRSKVDFLAPFNAYYRSVKKMWHSGLITERLSTSWVHVKALSELYMDLALHLLTNRQIVRDSLCTALGVLKLLQFGCNHSKNMYEVGGVLAWLVVTVLVGVSEQANVVVINPYFAHSHFAFLVKLTDILADNGHNMTMIVNELDTSKSVPLPKSARIIIRSQKPSMTLSGNLDQSSIWNTGFEFWDTRIIMQQFHTDIEGQCERFLSDVTFARAMAAEKFEFALLEPTDFCGHGFLKMIGVENYVNTYPMALSEKVALASGLPGRNFEPYPSSFDYHPGMDFFQRFQNYILPFVRHQLHGIDDNGISSAAIRKYVDPNFHAHDAIAGGRYLFLNTEEHMDFPRPISHKIVYIGGITVDQSASGKLPADYAEIFDNAKKGVVFVSFGSLAHSASMSMPFKQAFLDMFKANPDISFIWKYENASDAIGDHLPNLFKRSWVPQKEILAHPKLLAFVTHGGMNSILESGHAGVPLLGIPLFGDQNRNLKMLEYRRTAIVIEKKNLIGETLIDAIHKLTNDTSYKHRARVIADLARSKPQSGKQRFISYFNHAVAFAHADDHLDMEHRKFDAIRYYNLDVFSALAALGLVATFVLVRITLALFVAVSKLVNMLSLDNKKRV